MLNRLTVHMNLLTVINLQNMPCLLRM